jgi:hypothetical protein
MLISEYFNACMSGTASDPHTYAFLAKKIAQLFQAAGLFLMVHQVVSDGHYFTNAFQAASVFLTNFNYLFFKL